MATHTITQEATVLRLRRTAMTNKAGQTWDVIS